jgi:hypothetical protein
VRVESPSKAFRFFHPASELFNQKQFNSLFEKVTFFVNRNQNE